jgi:hypothetical protein
VAGAVAVSRFSGASSAVFSIFPDAITFSLNDD